MSKNLLGAYSPKAATPTHDCASQRGNHIINQAPSKSRRLCRVFSLSRSTVQKQKNPRLIESAIFFKCVCFV